MAYTEYTVNCNKTSDPVVKEYQAKLNTLRGRLHQSWEYLNEDGYYGLRTGEAIKQFKIFRGITPVSTIMGPTTMMYIDQELNSFPQLIADTPTIKKSESKFMENLTDKFPVLNVTNQIETVISALDSFVKNEIRIATHHGSAASGNLFFRYKAFATSQSSNCKKLEKIFLEQDKTKAKMDSVENQARKRGPYQRAAQRTYSYNQQRNNILKKDQAVEINNLIKELKKFDIVTKLENFLESKGITGKIELKQLKGKSGFKIKGGGILTVLSLKDLIYDIARFDQWGTEEWCKTISRDFFSFLDGIILGYAAMVISELIVGAVVAVAGLTISAGWIVAIVAVVAVAIAALLTWILNMNEISFSEKACEGYMMIIDTIKM